MCHLYTDFYNCRRLALSGLKVRIAAATSVDPDQLTHACSVIGMYTSNSLTKVWENLNISDKVSGTLSERVVMNVNLGLHLKMRPRRPFILLHLKKIDRLIRLI